MPRWQRDAADDAVRGLPSFFRRPRPTDGFLPSPRQSTDRIAELAYESGEPVGEVLREVADFRLALETDMLIAAAAVEAGEGEIAVEVVEGELLELAHFHTRMLDRLAQAEAGERTARRVTKARTRTRAVRLATVAAAIVAVVGGGQAIRTSTPATEPMSLEQQAQQNFGVLARASLRDAPAAELVAASQRLHATLVTLIDEHAATDDDIAALVAELLQREEQLIKTESGGAMRLVLLDARKLALRLRRVLPPGRHVPSPPAVPSAQPAADPQPSPGPSARPGSDPAQAPRPSATASPKASPSSSPSPEPSGSAKPSPSPSGPLPFGP